MPLFDDRISALTADPGDADLNTIFADLTSAYTEDMSVPAAKIAELESALAESTAAIAELKARNYDLLIAVSGPSGESDDTGVINSDDDDEDSEGITTDDLFG